MLLAYLSSSISWYLPTAALFKICICGFSADMSQLLDINTWDHVCPVLLPVGAPTMSTVFIASVGILIPFTTFVIAFFVYLHGLWIGNAADDVSEYTKAAKGSRILEAQNDDVFLSVSAGRQGSFGESNQKRFTGSARPGSARVSVF